MLDDEKITWVSSFPKSGNTWVRAFISAYHNDGAVDINNMFGVVTDQAIRWYQACCSEPCGELSDAQLALLHPAAMLNLQQSLPYTPKLVKTHNANVMVHGVRLIPQQVTRRVMYIVRDPRDVAVSYAKHFGLSIDEAVDRMITPTMKIAMEDGSRAPHYTTSWANHVKSYAEADDLEVTIVKYEDLKEHPAKRFTWILDWLGVEVDACRVDRAIKATRLELLRKAERESGFRERSEKASAFFGKGQVGGWRGVLSEGQLARLEGHAGDVMEAFGYELSTSRQAVSATG